jgi:hypothetical protein
VVPIFQKELPTPFSANAAIIIFILEIDSSQALIFSSRSKFIGVEDGIRKAAAFGSKLEIYVHVVMS